MDTDDLSEEAYRAIIIEAERFNHDLTLRFGLLSYHCNDEKEYVDQSVRLIHEMKKLRNHEIDDMFFGNPPEKLEFLAALVRILKNIEELKRIPPDKRTYANSSISWIPKATISSSGNPLTACSQQWAGRLQNSKRPIFI